ncbi:hypothetical protein [Pedobacter immunditicola]|uniref:hypothetical protein n=1 Tax=Pedobacter immunditicola TaxID=3133440 RepID=UPI0030A84EB3
MKTDLVEIFQTIRASLQPYATLGFSNRLNTDDTYDLWSDKNIEIASEKRAESFFASVSIQQDHVLLSTGFDCKLLGNQTAIEIKQLDDVLMNQIEETFAAGYKVFKEQEWV